MMESIGWGEFFALASAVSWALAVVMFRQQGRFLPPFELNLFKNALAIDPGFTDAKLALARNYQQKAATGLISLDEAKQSARPLLLQV
jgi:hypothetical protein